MGEEVGSYGGREVERGVGDGGRDGRVVGIEGVKRGHGKG